MKIESVLAAKGQKVLTIEPDASIADAVHKLARHHIGALVVTSESLAPQGILSERDIIRTLETDPGCVTRRVRDLMTTEVTCGSPSDDVDAALQTMTVGRFRHLPILDEGRLVGIVSIGNLVKARLKEYAGDVETLQTRLMDR